MTPVQKQVPLPPEAEVLFEQLVSGPEGVDLKELFGYLISQDQLFAQKLGERREAGDPETARDLDRWMLTTLRESHKKFGLTNSRTAVGSVLYAARDWPNDEVRKEATKLWRNAAGFPPFQITLRKFLRMNPVKFDSI